MYALSLSAELVAPKCCSLFLSSREFSGKRRIKNSLRNGASPLTHTNTRTEGVIPACLLIPAHRDAGLF